MNIRILAASDRNNYGDLLFPLVITKFIQQENISYDKLENYGIIESNLSDVGALPTKNFNNLITNIKSSNSEELIIVAGGEVLGSDWLNIYRFLSPLASKIHKSLFLRRILNRIDFVSLYFSLFKGSSFPFILNKSPFTKKNVKVVYNSIGGSNIDKYLKKSNGLRRYFRNLAWLSVRDTKTKAAFDKFSVSNKLVPDSALIMSDIFKTELETEISQEVRDLQHENYIYVQLGNTKGPDDLDKFAHQLNQFAAGANVKIVLSPIGLALDHDDEIILRKLQAKCPGSAYLHPNNIYDTMALLKNAKMYIGTSLHGVVTSQSFNIPFVAFTEKIKKLDLYIKTWFNNSSQVSLDYKDFAKVNEVYSNFNRGEANRILQQQKKEIYDNLYKIFLNG
ncbi:polysaccharide pyruvyl transferase family protein [Sphingobacterium thalpophilum]|uniref:Polysaccharide pyruvyl transferase family protein n=1 Tax=Sphingobacterium thalpophilum TaxID=259 RepID=A0ABV4HAX1_9SPHI